MKIIFMGTPAFARTSLEALLTAGFDIRAVFTQPDRPKGRGLKTESSPVKALAAAKNIPVFQPEKLRDNPEVLEQLKKIQPDLIVVVAYRGWLPAEILNLPKFGCINLHASLLPRYRGAAPIQWAILNGEKTTGVSVIILNEKMDEGDIIAEEEIEIETEETAGQLEPRLARLGASLLTETLPRIETGKINRIPQTSKPETPSYAPPVKKEDGLIDWSRPAEKIVNKIRAFNPRPAAFSRVNGKYIKILRAAVTSGDSAGANGEIIKITRDETLVKTGARLVNLKEIQLEGGKAMSPFDYSLGRAIKIGDTFEKQ